MSKSILVTATPKSCRECNCKGYIKGFNELCCMPLVNSLYTTKLISLNGIRKDCPLQDTSELLKDYSRLRECVRNSDDVGALERLYEVFGDTNANK